MRKVIPVGKVPRQVPAASQRRKRIADEAILDAATGEFAAHGFQAASMEAVASRAGTTKPTLYARFGPKEALFRAAFEREAAHLRSALLDAYALGPEAPLRERLHRYVHAYFDFGARRPDALRLLFVSDGAFTAAITTPIHDELTARIAELVARETGNGQPSRTDHLLAALIAGAVHDGAGAAAAHGVPVAEAAAVTEQFLRGALVPPR